MPVEKSKSHVDPYPCDALDPGSGDAANFGVSIRSINLKNGDQIELQPSGVTAIVGANNAGKSTILKETSELLPHGPAQHSNSKISVASLSIARKGSREDFMAWVAKNLKFVTRNGISGFLHPEVGLFEPYDIASTWESHGESLGQLAPILALYGNAQGRFNIGGSIEKRELLDDPPQHPLHYLEDSKSLFQRINQVSRDVFGPALTLDTLGRTIRLRIGQLGSEMPRLDEITPEFRSEMAALRPLDEQGDGMRSLMGQLLPVVTGAYRIILLDEPEAFLHPPQAHALGVELGKLSVENGVQILIATHDRALLTGLLDSQVDVSVVRLARHDGTPTARRLDAQQLRSLWSDPVLKYTNVLDGLFHRLVVVAEAEGDCAYLSAALDCEGRSEGPLPRNEVLFVPTGGKDGIPKVCKALTGVGVPTVAAPDLDVLSDQSKLRILVESLGGEWTSDLQQLWKEATEGIRGSREPATVDQVLRAINNALESRKGEKYSAEIKEDVEAQMRTSESPWSQVKRHGLSMFKGQERTAVNSLLERLDSIGLVLVREGELERLAPDVAVRKGPGWLPAALRQKEQCNNATQAHVDRILGSARSKLAL